jgi:hypothetical protein
MLDPRVQAAYARLSPEQRARLSLALADRHASSGAMIPRLDRTGSHQLFPVSAGQHRLWFLDQLRPGSTAYVVPAAIELCGRLDQAALTDSLNRLVARHESLRTTFPSTGGRPSARIGVPEPVALVVRDLRGEPVERIEATVEEARLAEASQPFDLAHGPLLRSTLLRVTETRHILLLTTHHIAVDGWSLAILLDELATLYAQATAGTPATLPDLAVQYVDFAAWQQAWLRGPVAQEKFGYWRQALRAVPSLDLSPDHGASGTDVALPVGWPGELIQGLHEVAKPLRATLFMTLLAALAAVLSRWSGQRDIVIGTPVAGRPLPQLEPVVGFFANTLALRLSLDGELSFRDLLGRARQACVDGFACQEVPYQNVVEMLPPQRRSAPLVRVMLALGNDLATEAAFGADMTLKVLPPAPTAPKFDLTWEVAPDGTGGLTGRVEYDPALFSQATVQRLHQSFSDALGQAVTGPDRPLDLPPVTHVLPSLPAPRVAPSGEAVPRDAIERLLATVWAEVLDVERVGVHDDFFVMGGHSLLATAAVAQVQEALGMPVPLEGALGATTIREFGVYLRELGEQAGLDVAGLAERAASGTNVHVPDAAAPRALDRELFRAAG